MINVFRDYLFYNFCSRWVEETIRNVSSFESFIFSQQGKFEKSKFYKKKIQRWKGILKLFKKFWKLKEIWKKRSKFRENFEFRKKDIPDFEFKRILRVSKFQRKKDISKISRSRKKSQKKRWILKLLRISMKKKKSRILKISKKRPKFREEFRKKIHPRFLIQTILRVSKFQKRILRKF